MQTGIKLHLKFTSSVLRKGIFSRKTRFFKLCIGWLRGFYEIFFMCILFKYLNIKLLIKYIAGFFDL